MTFYSTDLVPGSYRILLKQAIFRIPLTPFFSRAASSADLRTRGFHGDYFYQQFKSSGPFVDPEDKEIFCGTDAYRVFTSVDLDSEANDPWNGSRTRDYVFDTTNNQVKVETIEVGRPTIGNIWPNSPTTATQGSTDHEPPDHVEITLSEPIEKAWLEGKLGEWLSQSEDFREATGGGMGMYSYIGQGATKSESDGYLATVGGGHVLALPTTFGGTPYGMTGDEGEYWNGNFSAWMQKVWRKNEPIVHREVSENYYPDINMRVGPNIYRQGYAEVELSEPVSGWRDDFGVFNEGEELEDAPLSAASGWDIDNLLNYIGDGKGHELTLVSRTGHQYRVTIEAGSEEWSGEQPQWSTYSTHVLTTNAQTLKVSYEFPDPGQWANLRVVRIEKLVHNEWKTVSDLNEGQWPGNRIGTTPCGNFLLLGLIRKRSGIKWGFPEFDSPWTSRYRKKTSRMHLSPGTVELDSGTCGGDLSGSYDCEWIEEFDPDTGLQQPRNVTQWSAVINGTDWTPEEPPYSAFVPGGSKVVDTTTRERWEGEHTWQGRFVVAFDGPDNNGKILSQSVMKMGVTFSDDRNRTAETSLDPPTSGSTLFFGGYRLTYL
ncbi:MAG: hypothetical protein H7A51_03990 [Akkermansiaceae bacterium]|nr:hypothetical protein [Akkermansiaceae bacterium]